MAPLVHADGGLIDTSAGRVHILRYTSTVTLELAQLAQAHYIEHLERLGDHTSPLVLITDQPLPLPGMDVRKYWRTTTNNPGFEGIAAILPGLVGLMAATVTHFGEQLVGVLDVNVRSFKTSDEAAEWLANRYNCEIDEFDLQDAIDEVINLVP